MFVANEVAEILGYTNPQKAVRDNCKHSKLFKCRDSRLLTSSPYGINLIPESDAYRLIMRSKLPAADQFEAWVTEASQRSKRMTCMSWARRRSYKAQPSSQPDTVTSFTFSRTGLTVRIVTIEDWAIFVAEDAFFALN